jgi:hypothetical protein
LYKWARSGEECPPQRPRQPGSGPAARDIARPELDPPPAALHLLVPSALTDPARLVRLDAGGVGDHSGRFPFPARRGVARCARVHRIRVVGEEAQCFGSAKF